MSRVETGEVLAAVSLIGISPTVTVIPDDAIDEQIRVQ